MSYFPDPVLDDDDNLFSDEPSAPPPVADSSRANPAASYELSILEQILQAQQVASSYLNEQTSVQRPNMPAMAHAVSPATQPTISPLPTVAHNKSFAMSTAVQSALLPAQAYYASNVEQDLLHTTTMFATDTTQPPNVSISLAAGPTPYPMSYVDYRSGAYSPMSNASSTLQSNPASPTFPPTAHNEDLALFPDYPEAHSSQGPTIVLPTSPHKGLGVRAHTRPRRLTDSEYWQATGDSAASKSAESLAIPPLPPAGSMIRKNWLGDALKTTSNRPRSHSASSLNQPDLRELARPAGSTTPSGAARKLKRRASSIIPDYSKGIPPRALTNKERAALKRSSNTSLRKMPSITSSMNGLYIAPHSHMVSPVQGARSIELGVSSPTRASFIPEGQVLHHDMALYSQPSLLFNHSTSFESDMDAQMGFMTSSGMLDVPNPAILAYSAPLATQPLPSETRRVPVMVSNGKLPISSSLRQRPVSVLDDLSSIDFDDITVTHLKRLLKQRGRETRGKKSELIQRLKEEIEAVSKGTDASATESPQRAIQSPASSDTPLYSLSNLSIYPDSMASSLPSYSTDSSLMPSTSDSDMTMWLEMLNQAIHDGKLGHMENGHF